MRAQLLPIAVIVLAIVVVDLAIAYGAQTALVPMITKKVTAAKLLPVRSFVRTVALLLVVASPLAASALAARCQTR